MSAKGKPSRPEALPPFRWHEVDHHRTCAHVRAHTAVEFADLVRDMADGIREVVSMLHRSGIDAGSVDEHGHGFPELPSYRADALERLVLRAAELVSFEAQKFGDLVDAGAKGGQV